MDFIERWFGLFPDGGNGSLEALYLGTTLFAIAVVCLCRRLSPTVLAVHMQRRLTGGRD
jgi:hypothetical protein